MKKVILYVRVSTDEQAKLGYSLGHQELILTKFCEIKGWEVVAIYREDFSAKNFERPEYSKLFKYCKANKRDVDYVLISKWDRFSRNQTDALQELKKLTAIGIEVNAAEQWIDFAIPHNKMMLAIYLTIPEIDNDVRGINTKMGLRRSLKSGRFVGQAPAGYKNERDHGDKPILVLHEIFAPLVKESFELFATGLYATDELRRIMQRKGLKVSRTRFPEMLKSVLYMGKVYIPAFKDEEEEVVEGVHEAIVSPELFEKVQRVLKAKATGKKKHYDKLNENTPLRAMLSCPKCGHRMTSSSSKGRSKHYDYYHCQPACGERIPVEKAHKALVEYFNEVPVRPEIADLYLETMEHIFKTEESGNNNDLQKYKVSLEN
ncbi:MAG TPA: recombinase family protein, partial [Cytophagaceae bacterium]|nr:recombinase family protein [Cytophagaceae bacterium]